MSEKPVTAPVRPIETGDGFRYQLIQPYQVAAILEPHMSVHTLLERASAELENSGEPLKAPPEQPPPGRRHRYALRALADQPQADHRESAAFACRASLAWPFCESC